MIIFLTILSWVVFAIGNIFMAKWHVNIRDKAIAQKKKIAILHGVWAIAYIVISFLPMIPHWLTSKWMCSLLGFSFAMLHASIFPVYYNKYSNFPDFNLSKTSTSFFDRAQVWLKFKTSKFVNVAAFILSISSLIFFILKL